MVSEQQQRAQWLSGAVHAASVAAAYIEERSRTRLDIQWEEKSATDFVSSVDLGAEERIRTTLTERIPGIRIIGEELGADCLVEDGLVAVVDPLDGTTNFLHGYPAYGVSICIALDGVPVAGVVHDVARGGVYTATAGGGAFANDVRLQVSTIEQPTRALIGTGFPFRDTRLAHEYLAQMHALMPLVAGMRRAGSAALDLADVACGRFDAFWEQTLNPWDFGAGMLLIREAGGRVTDFAGIDATLHAGPIVASNGVLHDWFLRTLSDAARGA